MHLMLQIKFREARGNTRVTDRWAEEERIWGKIRGPFRK